MSVVAFGFQCVESAYEALFEQHSIMYRRDLHHNAAKAKCGSVTQQKQFTVSCHNRVDQYLIVLLFGTSVVGTTCLIDRSIETPRQYMKNDKFDSETAREIPNRE
jgi:hypothetical protein